MAGDKRTMRTNDTPAWRGWIFPLAMIALWCSPAAAVNVTHGLQSGREPALIVAAVFAVFGAAMAGLRLETQRSIAGRAVTTTCLAVLITFNFSNAVGLSAGHRDHGRSAALTEQTARESLADDKKTITRTISRLDMELGASSLSSLRTEIAAAEYAPAFSRSKRCADATVTESRAHCAGLERAKAMLSAAEQRDRLAGELATINAQLRAAPIRESVDPQSEAIAQALAFVGLVVEPRDVGYGLVLLFALGIELMAAFGASWCGVRFPIPCKPVNTPLAAATVAPKAPAAQQPAQVADGPLAAFVSDLVKCERPTPFKALYERYEAVCRAAGSEPESRRAVGLALSKRFDKVKGGDAAYFAHPRIAAVAAVA